MADKGNTLERKRANGHAGPGDVISPLKKLPKGDDMNRDDEILKQLKYIKKGQDEILERINNVETNVTKVSDEVTELKNNQAKAAEVVSRVEKDIGFVSKEMKRVKFELNRLEQYSRKASIRVYNIEEEENEKTAEKVIKAIKEETGVEIEPAEIDIVHRNWSKKGKKDRSKPRAILVKFVSHPSKVKIMKKRREAKKIKISEDLAQGTRNMLNDIYKHKQRINVEKAWAIDGRIKYKFQQSERVYEIRSYNDFINLVSEEEMEE